MFLREEKKKKKKDWFVSHGKRNISSTVGLRGSHIAARHNKSYKI